MMMRVQPGLGPLLNRELTVALRRRRAAVMQMMGLVVTALFAVGTAALHNAFGDAYKQGAEPFGRDIMLSAFSVVILLLNFVMPSLTASSVTEERERRTLDLLLVTRMTPADIVLAKLLSGAGQGLLFIAASVPAVAFGFLYGGIAVSDVILGYALLVLIMLMFTSLGMFSSSRAINTRMAVGGAYGLGGILLMPMIGGFAPLAIAYRNRTSDGTVAGVVVLITLLITWMTTSCALGAITGIGPASRDPGPSARKNLLFIVATSVIASIGVGVLADPAGAEVMCGVLFVGLCFTFFIASILLATEDPPARLDAAAPLWWRSNNLVGVAWLAVLASIAFAVVPSVALREVTGPWLSMKGAMGMVPFFLSIAGLASLTRLMPARRAGRRILVGLALLSSLTVPLIISFLMGNMNPTLAPPWMMIWLHPATLIMATRPAATTEVGITGPFGWDLTLCFVMGHLLIALVGIAVGNILGKPAPRMDG